MKIKEVNERSGKMTQRKSEGTTWCIRRRGAPTHPYLLHFQPDKNSRCGEQFIGLDPTQQWLICSTYMSQMVGFQCSWCRKSTQEYWSFFLSAWSPQELNICTNLEGERWRNPSLAWRQPECSSSWKNRCTDFTTITTKYPSPGRPDRWRFGLAGCHWLAQGVVCCLSLTVCEMSRWVTVYMQIAILLFRSRADVLWQRISPFLCIRHAPWYDTKHTHVAQGSKTGHWFTGTSQFLPF